jgi:beta-fructofuranosidase
VQHPSRFVWDFWYHYDPTERLFHLLYLNAPPQAAPHNKHHWVAQVGYATTSDFTSIAWHDDAVFVADPTGWDNTAIWTGDVLPVAGGYLMFYTSRDGFVRDGLTQNVGAAFSPDFRQWERLPAVRITPDDRFYEAHTHPADDTIHAWRDPFLFRHEGRPAMLLSAKVCHHAACRKGAVALLHSDDLLNWRAGAPLYAPGLLSECEVPHMVAVQGGVLLVYSGWACGDHALRQGGLHAVEGPTPLGPFTGPPRALLPESSGLYAARLIPELGGDLVAHDFQQGGLRRVASGLAVQPLPRDFSDFGPGIW